MIGINDQGKVKVWINEKFGNNHPENEKPKLYLAKPIASSVQK